MASSANVHDDADFVSEVSDELKCIICHMVLRIPLQHMNCGHRFCSSCFDEMKKYSERLNSKLICPVDREDIDLAMVFEDKGMHRMIRALEVKCKQHGDGCPWIGCLSDLETHLERCQYQKKQDSLQSKNDDAEIYEQLLERIVRCEDVSMENEKQLESLNLSMEEMKEEMKIMKELYEELKELNKELKDEIISLKRSDVIFIKEYQAEMKSLHVVNEQLDEKIKQISEQSDDVLSSHVNTAVEDCKQYVNDQVKLCEEKIEHLEETVMQETLPGTVAKIISDIQKIDEELRTLGNDFDKTTNSTVDEMKELKSNTRNIENVLFLHKPISQKEIKYKWVLQNHKHHFEKGTAISPVFFSQLLGYRFQIAIIWKGDNKQNLSVYLLLSRGENEEGLIPKLPPFKYEYEFEALNKTGGSKKHKVTSSIIEFNKDNCFTIRDNENTPENLGCGASEFLVWPYRDYIINDSMYLGCTIFL